MNKTIVFNNNLDPNKREYKLFLQAADRHDIKLIDVRDIENEVLDTFLEDLSFCAGTINRSHLEKYITHQYGLKQTNKLTDMLFWRDKIHQMRYLRPLPCNIPKTIISNTASFEEISDLLGVPFIAKRANSSKGAGVELIRTYNDFKGDYQLYQEPVWTSFGKDIRVVAFKGDVICAYERDNTASGNFRSNIAQGGIALQKEIDDDMKNIAKVLFMRTQYDIMGFDLMYGKTGYVFCEVNSCPDVVTPRETCGVDLADYYML